MVFLGGAVLADIMKNRPEFWVSREEWFEKGVAALDKLGRRIWSRNRSPWPKITWTFRGSISVLMMPFSPWVRPE